MELDFYWPDGTFVKTLAVQLPAWAVYPQLADVER